MISADCFIKQSSGLFQFMSWVYLKTQMGFKVDKFNDFYEFDSKLSSEFALCKSSDKRADNPFLLVQKTAAKWMQLIKWDALYIVKGSHRIYIKSKVIYGDSLNYEDYQPFVISISFDHIEKIKIIENMDYISARYTDVSQKRIRVNYRDVLFHIPVRIVNDKKLIITKEEKEVLNKTSLNKFRFDENFDLFKNKEVAPVPIQEKRINK